ncbi:Transcriptional regulatory protein sin3 [Steccherinum ochraceum]|uniref:Transcriptional regulatory protein sin3 n=1 Tax=Steccherinum ochraceum TaxID=92696 RepID=A0A4R0RCK4_9APHY|nr:Transcriptional regulatory protein sin3 [Steccherinum ochraceum]
MDASTVESEFQYALQFLNKVKNRYGAQSTTYKKFLELLQTYQTEHAQMTEIFHQVAILFKGAPELTEEFKSFIPVFAGR